VASRWKLQILPPIIPIILSLSGTRPSFSSLNLVGDERCPGARLPKSVLVGVTLRPTQFSLILPLQLLSTSSVQTSLLLGGEHVPTLPATRHERHPSLHRLLQHTLLTQFPLLHCVPCWQGCPLSRLQSGSLSGVHDAGHPLPGPQTSMQVPF
jgi:hypothetical protein